MRDDFVLSLNGDGADGAPSPSTILLVDDDTDMRSLTRTFLEHEGYCVFTSGDAHRAAQIFSSVPRIDLLITDMYMPGRSGMELAFDMKTMRPNLPILMISGGFVDDDVKERLLQESWRFMVKPFRFTELLATVHVMLAASEAERSRVS
jgi:two-component system chemotaxis response regulator CheY